MSGQQTMEALEKILFPAGGHQALSLWGDQMACTGWLPPQPEGEAGGDSFAPMPEFLLFAPASVYGDTPGALLDALGEALGEVRALEAFEGGSVEGYITWHGEKIVAELTFQGSDAQKPGFAVALITAVTGGLALVVLGYTAPLHSMDPYRCIPLPAAIQARLHAILGCCDLREDEGAATAHASGTERTWLFGDM